MSNSTLEIQSKGLYSSWCYHKPTRTLFDCGEGFATYQGNFIYGVERIFLSHGHGDHIMGLPSLIGCRNSGRGDREKPLDIYYPSGDWLVESIKSFIEDRNTKLNYKLTWYPITPGHSVRIGNNQRIEAFQMLHQGKRYTLGYRILESRKKLREEFIGRDIGKLLATGNYHKEEISVEYTANIFAYCLDAYGIEPGAINNCDLVVMDCTFIKSSDRNEFTHFTLTEAYEECKQSHVKQMIAAHFSPRYLFPQIKTAVEILNREDGNCNYVIPVYHNQVIEL